MEYIVVRKMRDSDGVEKWFTYYPRTKGGRPSNVFKLRKKAEEARLHLIRLMGRFTDDVKVVPYEGKESVHYIYLDRWQ